MAAIDDDKIEQLNRAVDAAAQGLKLLPAQTALLKEAASTYASSIQRTNERLRRHAEALENDNKTIRSHVQNTKALNQAIEEEIRAAKAQSRTVDEFNEKVKEIKGNFQGLSQATRQEIEGKINSTRRWIAVQSAYTSLVESAKPTWAQLSKAGGTILNSYRDSGNNITVAGAVLEGAVGAAGSAAQTAGKGIAGVGSAMMAIPGPSMAVGAALTVLGTGLNVFGGVAKEVAEKVLPFLSRELEKNIQVFQTISSTGAVFAGGLTEMVKTAGQAGMTVDLFGKIVDKNRQQFAESGMGIAGASKLFSNVSKSMGDAGFRGQLLNLGFTIEEQGALVADTFANMNRTGRLQGATAEDIARTSFEYGKTLRTISDITGKDAKAKMEQAKKDMDALDIQAKLLKLQKEQPDAYNKVQAQLALMPDEMKAGFLQMFVDGVVTDPATQVLMSRVPELESAYRKMVDDANNSSVTTAQATENTATALKAASKGFADNADSVGEIARAARLGATGIATDVAKLGQALLGGLKPFDQVSETGDRINAAAATTDRATAAMNKVIEKNLEMAMLIQNEILTPNVMGMYADQVVNATQAMIDLIRKFTGSAPQTNETQNQIRNVVSQQRQAYQGEIPTEQIQSQTDLRQQEIELLKNRPQRRGSNYNQQRTEVLQRQIEELKKKQSEAVPAQPAEVQGPPASGQPTAPVQPIAPTTPGTTTQPVQPAGPPATTAPGRRSAIENQNTGAVQSVTLEQRAAGVTTNTAAIGNMSSVAGGVTQAVPVNRTQVTDSGTLNLATEKALEEARGRTVTASAGSAPAMVQQSLNDIQTMSKDLNTSNDKLTQMVGQMVASIDQLGDYMRDVVSNTRTTANNTA